MLEAPGILPRFGVRSCILGGAGILCSLGFFFSCLPFGSPQRKSWKAQKGKGVPKFLSSPSEEAQIHVQLRKEMRMGMRGVMLGALPQRDPKLPENSQGGECVEY